MLVAAYLHYRQRGLDSPNDGHADGGGREAAVIRNHCRLFWAVFEVSFLIWVLSVHIAAAEAAFWLRNGSGLPRFAEGGQSGQLYLV